LKLEELLITLFAILCGACLIALIGWALWRQGTLPLAPGTWLKQRLETAAFLRGLSVGLEAQRPIPELIMQLVRSDISPRNRGKWTAVFDELLRGGPLALGLKKQRLVTPSEAALIDCAQRVGNLHWVLRMVAETIERRTSYRMQAFGYALRTLALLFVGGLVALVVLAYFMPLIQLIQYEVDSI
jgi:type II secretory pathway component PulF